MKTTEIIKEIERLPYQRQIFVLEKTIHSMRQKDNTNGMKHAAQKLYSDYKENKELTAFTKLDYQDFYETK